MDKHSDQELETKIEVIGEMPPCFDISNFLWGVDASIDSDGNSDSADSTNWNELTLVLRSDINQRIDIEPVEGLPKFLMLRATSKDLIQSVVSFLQHYGTIK